jgi:serine/threonine-protein kinase
MEFCPDDGARLPPAFVREGSALSREPGGLPREPGVTEAQLAWGLARRFRIVRRLGTGGMGSVFLAEQLAVGNRPVALKVLLRKLLDDPEFLLRFQNEAASTGRIHHPNVVTIYESGQGDDGTPYIVMEYLEGETLRHALKTCGALPLAECAEILQQAARGLNAAHKLRIIHRDIKPDNIFLTRDDEGELIVKVVDFGIAKLRESATQTLTGTVLGTPAYMSYEQAFGMKSDHLDARSDIYSLGVVVYEMLTGRVPFHSDTPQGYLRKHLLDQPPPFHAVKPDLPALPEVEKVVMKALAKERDRRYSSVVHFAREFAQAAASVGQPSPSAPEQAGLARDFGRGAVPAPGSPPPIQRETTDRSGSARVGGAEPSPTPPVLRPPSPPQEDRIERPLQEGHLPGGSPLTSPMRPPVVASPSAGRILPLDGPPAPQVRSPVMAKTPQAPVPPQLRPEAATKYALLALAAAGIISFAVWHFSQSGVEQPPRKSTTSGFETKPPTPPARMVAIPSGSFTMGREHAQDSEETPAHSVTVASFYLDKTPVTNAQYAQFVRATGRVAPSAWPGGNYPATQAEWPVTYVSWYDAEAYCQSIDGRLPTEAEWEYAARGTDGRLYPWGDDFNSAPTNSAEASLGHPEMVGAHVTAASPFGVLDMSGNVWQWTEDTYRPYPGHRATFKIPADARVVRGGSYESDKDHVTATARNLDHATSRSPFIGFRCAK